MPGRGRIHETGGVTVIDESYNASPACVHASLVMLGELDASKRYAVLGDMKELGRYAEERHRRLGEFLARSNTDAVFWLGEQGRTVGEGIALGGGKTPLRVYDSIEPLVGDVGNVVSTGDAVLVKASRVCNLDLFVVSLLKMLDCNTEN